jgi:tRNA-Thr(GGU) m(6)t(6)A37 methyltransferase TsaA
VKPESQRPPQAAVAYEVSAVGVVESALRDPRKAPLQGDEGAPEAWLSFYEWVRPALDGLVVGDEIVLLTWLHLADRSVLRVHPRGDVRNLLRGVFGTRSPHRPNPIGLHRITVLEILGLRIRVGPLEAVDGTPIIDVKAILNSGER